MADTENTLLASKKRAARRELSRDNPGLDDEEEASKQKTGTFKRDSDESVRLLLKLLQNYKVKNTVSEESKHDEKCRENNDDGQTENKLMRPWKSLLQMKRSLIPFWREVILN